MLITIQDKATSKVLVDLYACSPGDSSFSGDYNYLYVNDDVWCGRGKIFEIATGTRLQYHDDAYYGDEAHLDMVPSV
nr:hypothetical protein [Candidatus Sigynarchaeota archaeon]